MINEAPHHEDVSDIGGIVVHILNLITNGTVLSFPGKGSQYQSFLTEHSSWHH